MDILKSICILQIQIPVHYLRFVIISAFLLLPHFQSASLNHNIRTITLQSSTVHDSIEQKGAATSMYSTSCSEADGDQFCRLVYRWRYKMSKYCLTTL